MDSIKELTQKIIELNKQKLGLESKLAEVIKSVIDEVAEENRHQIQRVAPNIFVIKVSKMIANPWQPQFYDWKMSAGIVMEFLRTRSASTWKQELQRKLDESSTINVVFEKTTRLNGVLYKDKYYVDTEFIKKIISKL